jgi:hypothetical protein
VQLTTQLGAASVRADKYRDNIKWLWEMVRKHAPHVVDELQATDDEEEDMEDL